MNPNALIVIAAVIMAIVTLVLMAMILMRYVKVGPNQMLVVSGRKVQLPNGTFAGFRVVRGGGTFVLPIIEKAEVLSLEVQTIEMPGLRARTSDGAGVQADCVAQVKIDSNDNSVLSAVEYFLGKSAVECTNIVRPVLEKHVSNALSASTAELISQNPASCADAAQKSAAADLAKMGMTIVSLTLRKIRS